MTSATAHGAIEAFEQAAIALETAAKHCRLAAGHMQAGDVPRASAHAFAAIGDHNSAGAALEVAARIHASKAIVN